MTIFDYRTPCVGVDIQSCMVVQRVDDDETTYFYEGIEGFSYQWGYRSQLLVNITEVEDPPADGSSFSYRMIELVDRSAVAAGATFEVILGPGYATADGGGGFVFPDGRELICDDAGVCNEIGDRLANPQDQSFTLVISHPDDPTDTSKPLIAQEIR